jgi:hypothetical protein
LLFTTRVFSFLQLAIDLEVARKDLKSLGMGEKSIIGRLLSVFSFGGLSSVFFGGLIN